MNNNSSSRMLLRYFPWLFSILIVVVIYFLLEQKMENQIEIATSDIKTEKIEDQLKSLGQMEILHYKFKDVLFYRDLKEYMAEGVELTDSEPIIVINGIAVGGIDFTRIADGDILHHEDSVTVNLPKAEFFKFIMEDDYRVISESDLDESSIQSAFESFKAEKSLEEYHSQDLDIKHEQVLTILEPVLENMTSENLSIKFKD